MGVKLWLYDGKLKGFKAPNGYWWVEETDLLRELKARGISAPRRLMKERKPKFSVLPIEINVQAAKDFGLKVHASGRRQCASTSVAGETLEIPSSPLHGKPTGPDTLTPADAASILGVTAWVVRKWVQGDRLKATKSSSGHLRIQLKDINAILEARRSPQPMVYFAGRSNRLGTLVSGVAERLGHKGRAVSTLAEAVDALALTPASLLLLDMAAFPGAWKLIRKVRSTAIYGSPKIVLLVKGPLAAKDELNAMRLGLNGCLSHTISEEVLCSEIKAQLWKPGG
ncbi:MAG: helix-turn-helix domain-containing protein [Planctomycetes bacterium]|nr:helix-turn-helix domain-containing protein [Planctomycetota bacterium]